MARVLEEHMRGRKFVLGDTVTVGDFVLAYTLDWAKMANLLNGLPQLEAYMEQMYARPHAPMRIAEALAARRPCRATPPCRKSARPRLRPLPGRDHHSGHGDHGVRSTPLQRAQLYSGDANLSIDPGVYRRPSRIWLQ